MPQMSQVLREHAIGMLTAGMSTRAVAGEFNVHFSTISRLQRRFREFGSTSKRRPRVTTPAQDLHIQHLHLQDRLRPATRTAAATIGLHYQIISAQTVRNRLREAHLHAHRPHRDLDLNAVCHQMLTFDGVWHFGELFSLWMNPGFHCTGQMADSVYGVVWVSGLLVSTLWIEWPYIIYTVNIFTYFFFNTHACVCIYIYIINIHRTNTLCTSGGLAIWSFPGGPLYNVGWPFV